jgi:hypothetical protein
MLCFSAQPRAEARTEKHDQRKDVSEEEQKNQENSRPTEPYRHQRDYHLRDNSDGERDKNPLSEESFM